MSPDVRVFPDPAAVAAAAAEAIAGALRDAVRARGRATLALSGGSSPVPAYRLLAARGDVPWDGVRVLWVDERCVPPDHPDSNYRLAREALLDHLPLPPAQVLRMPGEAPPPAGALAYERALRALGEDDALDLDVAVLGLGEDGHTASLFPGHPALDERSRWVLPTEAPKGSPVRDRLTLALPALAAARLALFVVTGASKRAAVAAALAGLAAAVGPATPPAARVRPINGRLVWLLDAAAAAREGDES